MSKLIDLDKVGITCWGEQKENDAVQLMCGAADFLALGEGIPVAVFRRHEGEPYIHACGLAGDTLMLTMHEKDTLYAGKCSVTFYWKGLTSSVCAKSKTYTGYIAPSEAAGLDTSDDLNSLFDKAKDLLEQISAAQELVFCDSLPAEGIPHKLYVVSGDSGVYVWENDAWQAKTFDDLDVHEWKEL